VWRRPQSDRSADHEYDPGAQQRRDKNAVPQLVGGSHDYGDGNSHADDDRRRQVSEPIEH